MKNDEKKAVRRILSKYFIAIGSSLIGSCLTSIRYIGFQYLMFAVCFGLAIAAVVVSALLDIDGKEMKQTPACISMNVVRGLNAKSGRSLIASCLSATARCSTTVMISEKNLAIFFATCQTRSLNANWRSIRLIGKRSSRSGRTIEVRLGM